MTRCVQGVIDGGVIQRCQLDDGHEGHHDVLLAEDGAVVTLIPGRRRVDVHLVWGGNVDPLTVHLVRPK